MYLEPLKRDNALAKRMNSESILHICEERSSSVGETACHSDCMQESDSSMEIKLIDEEVNRLEIILLHLLGYYFIAI